MNDHRSEQIKLACLLYHQGDSFESVAEKLNISISTCHNWSKSEIWQKEMSRLEQKSQGARDTALEDRHEKYREILEKSGIQAGRTAVRLLRIANTLAGDIEEELSTLTTVEKVRALASLSRAFKDLLQHSIEERRSGNVAEGVVPFPALPPMEEVRLRFREPESLR